MTERSLQITYRKGRPFAAYLHLSHATGLKSVLLNAVPMTVLARRADRVEHEQPTTLRIPVHREHSFRFNVNARSADAEHRF